LIVMTDTEHSAEYGQTIEEQTPEEGTSGVGTSGDGSVTAGSEVPGAASSLGGDERGPGNLLDDDADVEVIEGELDELTSVALERDRYLALAQRTQADFENYRKRVARDAAAAGERGVAKLAKELLPALDNLDRALDAAAQDDPLLDGVRLVRAELSAGLARVGIESFGAAGDTFDPVEHEAVAQQPVEDAVSGSVVEVYQPGYRLGASVIRPARVLVAA
jgi:molecular chaperone GrpE